jgi:two-component system sensor histidine kinase CpxA
VKTRFPLYGKILLWFFLNLLVLSVTCYALFRIQFRVGPELLLTGRAGERLQAVARAITGELEARPRAEWDEILERFSSAYGIRFLVYRNEGPQLAGDPVPLPAPVYQKLTGRALPRRGQAPALAPPEPASLTDAPAAREPRTARPGTLPSRPPFLVRTEDPKRYWLGLRLPVTDRIGERTVRSVTLVAISESLRAGGLLVDFPLWICLSAGAVLFSGLFWLPLVRGITRSLEQITGAAAQIAEGKFDIRVSERRWDELGSLGSAINRMASRLAGFVMGQKRFLGDIAHELCSPIARLQVAVGILEERADSLQKQYVEDMREDVQHMSGLVNELLSFSKASLGATNIRLVPVAVWTVVEKAVHREAHDDPQVQMNVPESLYVIADSELLVRSVSNLLRNAIRYAGQSGPITIAAKAENDFVELAISDQGPGVPENEIPRLFDPFYRVDASRARETGGVGLGLSIVKTCVETCGGTVTCRNLQPSGFAVLIRLPRTAHASGPSGSGTA